MQNVIIQLWCLYFANYIHALLFWSSLHRIDLHQAPISHASLGRQGRRLARGDFTQMMCLPYCWPEYAWMFSLLAIRAVCASSPLASLNRSPSCLRLCQLPCWLSCVQTGPLVNTEWMRPHVLRKNLISAKYENHPTGWLYFGCFCTRLVSHVEVSSSRSVFNMEEK